MEPPRLALPPVTTTANTSPESSILKQPNPEDQNQRGRNSQSQSVARAATADVSMAINVWYEPLRAPIHMSLDSRLQMIRSSTRKSTSASSKSWVVDV